ncbi:hypothetical protein ILYODFUR_030106 [Ilyodon furcidens]|uniref:Secreted protein n=1 Tax=Ilyodon furcidens TaxID=33524 RepID=A0ABV0V7C6_9TELE
MMLLIILLHYTDTIHPSIHPLSTTAFPGSRWGAGAYLQHSLYKRQGTPWTGHQSITETHRTNNHAHTKTLKGNLEKPIYLTVMFLDCGRKLKYPERTHACKGRTCKLHAERSKAGIQNPTPQNKGEETERLRRDI